MPIYVDKVHKIVYIGNVIGNIVIPFIQVPEDYDEEYEEDEEYEDDEDNCDEDYEDDESQDMDF